MLVCTQVRRQLRFKYVALCLQSSRKSAAPGPRSDMGQQPCVENKICGTDFRIQPLAYGPTQLGSEVEFSVVRNYFTSPSNRSAKPAIPESFTENGPVQGEMENSAAKFISVSPFPTHSREQERLAGENVSDITRSSSWPRRNSIGAIAAAVVLILGAVAAKSYEEESRNQTKGVLLSTGSILWDSVARLRKSIGRMVNEGAASVAEVATSTATLARCLISVLMTASEASVGSSGSWLKPRVAALVADLAAHEYRRKAVVEAGGGQVVDWLLKAVANVDGGNCSVTQAESARALSYLLSDESTREDVFSRPGALPYFFQFASSLHADQALEDYSKGQALNVGLEGLRGRSMLVTEIMDLITSSSDAGDARVVRPRFPENADPEDIAAALRVVKDGGWYVDDRSPKDGDASGKTGNDRKGVHGIGIRVVGGTGVVGVQREPYSYFFGDQFYITLMEHIKDLLSAGTLLSSSNVDSSKTFSDRSPRRDWGGHRVAAVERSRAKYGLWDDLQGRYITVTLAAWALANWAQASAANRSKILEMDKDGGALLAAIQYPEKTVKWHGAVAMRLLLGTKNFASDDIAPRWSSALLNVAAESERVKDTSLPHCALAALTACVSRSELAHNLVLQTGLPVMREIANQSETNTAVQGALAQLLDVLTSKGHSLPTDESKKWAATLLRWVCHRISDDTTRACGSRVLVRVLNNLGQSGIPISQAWLALLLVEVVSDVRLGHAKSKKHGNVSLEAKQREQLQNQLTQSATAAAARLGKVVAQEAAYRADASGAGGKVAESAAELPMIDLLGLDVMGNSTTRNAAKETTPRVNVNEAAEAVRKAIKALTELTAEEPAWRQRVLDAGALCLLRRFLLCNDYEDWFASEASESASQVVQDMKDGTAITKTETKSVLPDQKSLTPHIRKHAARLLSVLTLQPVTSRTITRDRDWFTWLESCADGLIPGCTDKKTRSYALTALLNASQAQVYLKNLKLPKVNAANKVMTKGLKDTFGEFWPRYEDTIFLMNPGSKFWKKNFVRSYEVSHEHGRLLSEQDFDSVEFLDHINREETVGQDKHEIISTPVIHPKDKPAMDVVFVHGLRGGPFKTWRLSENKSSATTPLVERIDEEAGQEGTCWPEEWLTEDLPRSRLLTIKYKTNLSEWSGASLPLQEVSSTLLDKLLAAGVGERPLVFVTHSMGGLVVKQMLLQAGKDKSRAHLVNQTTGVVFYSCPHFGSKLADMPWRIGLVLRPAPSIAELRSGSPRLEELNQCLRHLNKDGHLDVLSFSETKVTPLVEGYGGWGLRMEVVPIESAYPGFGELVVLPGTDHVNSCKPLNRADPAYTKTLEFLHNHELYAEKMREKSVG
ncbi:hypothetical protein R1flu_019451 [Riccia fluitans]|uniref:Protein SERAC1 n=1 Tax=Riccia fluitans TaxID=41844 RepID=A0ABD1ZIP9_9MARC